MSEQTRSEGNLFEDNPSVITSPPVSGRRSRASLGFNLPVVVPGHHSRSMSDPAVASASGPGRGFGQVIGDPEQGNGSPPRVVGTGNARGGARIDSGSKIGMAGFTPEEMNSLIFVGDNDDGSKIRINIFESVFIDGKVGSVELENILNYLEAAGKLDFSGFISSVEYQGFDRLVYIRAALRRVTISQFSRFAIMGAVRGSNTKRIRETSINFPGDLGSLIDNGTVIKKAVRREDLTILRFTASIPHWVSYWLFKVDFAKKIENEECPGYLQYPGAASLPMSKDLRIKHISFCKAFSALLPGGTFNANIYMTAFKNSIPEKDIPSMLKEQLGIGAVKLTQMTVEDLKSHIGQELVKRAG